MYLLRLDDAAQYMNIDNWYRIEKLLADYKIKPIVGVIPKVQDPELLSYNNVEDFWKIIHRWHNIGWTIAMHGYNHVYESLDGGINPVNHKSEFAGLELDIQKKKIRDSYKIFTKQNIFPKIFFAPAHTFDRNTLVAISEETPIRIISDTVANNVYYENNFYFIPQQAGIVRNLPFKLTTFCYHPNIMKNNDFSYLEQFIVINRHKFSCFSESMLVKRKKNIYDKMLHKMYFIRK